VIAAGVHRLQRVEPKDGMTFIGERGAVMSGARVLKSFTRDGNLWVASDQTQQGSVHPCGHPNGCWLPGHERDNRPEDLFLDGTRLRHVSSKSQVGPGQWFFDYGANKIYIGDDPARHRVETSVVDHAFYSTDAQDVVIANVTIRHYANPTQTGAIHARGTRGWTIRRVDASHNHAVGIHLGYGSHLHHSRMTHNGQMGLRAWGISRDGTFGAPMVIEHNEIAHNRELGYRWGWEGGAMKILQSKGTIFRNNWVHHNDGPGIWFDYNNHDTTIESNLVEHNEAAGIFYEVSYGDTMIRWNVVRENGKDIIEGPSGAGIYISNSRDTKVVANAVDLNGRGVLLRMVRRERGPDGRLELTNVKVTNNDIRMFSGTTGLVDETGNDAYYTSKGNVFEDNTYRLDDENATRFSWTGGYSSHTWQKWRAAGNDANGSLGARNAVPSLPEGQAGFQARSYGPSDRRRALEALNV